MERPVMICTGRSMEQTDLQYRDMEELGLKTSFTWDDYKPGYGWQIHIIVHNTMEKEWTGVIHFEAAIPQTAPRYFLPGFMYGRNRGESPIDVPRKFPRIREGSEQCPASSWWMVRGDRLSAPVCMVYDNGRVMGLQAAPYLVIQGGKKLQWNENNEQQDEFYRYAGYSCRIGKNIPGDERKYAAIGYTLGYENAPWLFVQSSEQIERVPLSEENCISIKEGESISVTLFLYDYEAETEVGIYKALRKTYTKYHQSPRKILKMTEEKAVSELAGAVSEAAWLPLEKCYSGFVRQKKDGTGYTYNKILSLSWTNGLSVAVPILMSALRLQNEEMRAQAITCIDHIVQHCMNPSSGLPYDGVNEGKWSLKGWWFDSMVTPGHSAYLVGQAVYYVLKAYKYESSLKDIQHADWLDFAAAIIEKTEKTRNTDFEYPFILSEKTGAGIEYNAFGGCWLMAAASLYSVLTGERKYLDGIVKSEQHYYDAYVAHAECYGTPLDTDKAVDSEGILAYLRSVRYLHQLTGETIYLEHMRDALDYEFTFKFCYNSPIKIPPLSKIGWSSCGGSITSTANPHIHPMSSTVVDEILYYVLKTNDTYVEERLQDTVGWGLQTFNTYPGEYDFGKTGWMSERFCYSQGLVTETYPDGTYASTWFALMPWASSSVLEGLTGDWWDLYVNKIKCD